MASPNTSSSGTRDVQPPASAAASDPTYQLSSKPWVSYEGGSPRAQNAHAASPALLTGPSSRTPDAQPPAPVIATAPAPSSEVTPNPLTKKLADAPPPQAATAAGPATHPRELRGRGRTRRGRSAGKARAGGASIFERLHRTSTGRSRSREETTPVVVNAVRSSKSNGSSRRASVFDRLHNESTGRSRSREVTPTASPLSAEALNVNVRKSKEPNLIEPTIELFERLNIKSTGRSRSTSREVTPASSQVSAESLELNPIRPNKSKGRASTNASVFERLYKNPTGHGRGRSGSRELTPSSSPVLGNELKKSGQSNERAPSRSKERVTSRSRVSERLHEKTIRRERSKSRGGARFNDKKVNTRREARGESSKTESHTSSLLGAVGDRTQKLSNGNEDVYGRLHSTPIRDLANKGGVLGIGQRVSETCNPMGLDQPQCKIALQVGGDEEIHERLHETPTRKFRSQSRPKSTETSKMEGATFRPDISSSQTTVRSVRQKDGKHVDVFERLYSVRKQNLKPANATESTDRTGGQRQGTASTQHPRALGRSTRTRSRSRSTNRAKAPSLSALDGSVVVDQLQSTPTLTTPTNLTLSKAAAVAAATLQASIIRNGCEGRKIDQHVHFEPAIVTPSNGRSNSAYSILHSTPTRDQFDNGGVLGIDQRDGKTASPPGWPLNQ